MILRTLFFSFLLFVVCVPAQAEYADEIRDQIRSIQDRTGTVYDLDYFHDMGIVARKADDAELTEITTEIVNSLLLSKMELYVRGNMQSINGQFVADPVKANRRLLDLHRYNRYFEPTKEYLSTTSGQATSTSMVRIRKAAMELLEKGCGFKSVREGILAIRKTGLFILNTPEEIVTLRELQLKVDCCLNWKRNVTVLDKQEFETDYEKGVAIEEGIFKLRTNPRNYLNATWEGKWVYRFDGREGKAEAVSTAIMTHERGTDIAKIKVSPAKVSSVGRINMPVNVSGDNKIIEMNEDFISPVAIYNSQIDVPFTGCSA